MKTISYSPQTSDKYIWQITSRFSQTGIHTSSHYPTRYPVKPQKKKSWGILTPEAEAEIAAGGIPNLARACEELYYTTLQAHGTHAALQVIPVLTKLGTLGAAAVKQLLQNPETNHVLVDNDSMKVVLIHWKPGTFSNVHGHPKGGCVVKVLHGSLEEKRFTPNESRQLLSVSELHRGSLSYIDDQMAYHAVGNPFQESAISLHIYA